jgi:hypothetical protein
MTAKTGGMQEQSKSSIVSVRLAPDEQTSVREQASKRGTSMSQFVRDAVLEKCAPPASANVNQFAASSTKVVGLTLQLDDAFQIVPQASGSPVVQLG